MNAILFKISHYKGTQLIHEHLVGLLLCTEQSHRKQRASFLNSKDSLIEHQFSMEISEAHNCCNISSVHFFFHLELRQLINASLSSFNSSIFSFFLFTFFALFCLSLLPPLPTEASMLLPVLVLAILAAVARLQKNKSAF